MFRIVANHLKMNALLLFTVFVVANVAYLFIAYQRGFMGSGGGLTALRVGIFAGSVMIVALFLREEQNKGQMVYRSLPLPHSKIVSAMYFLAFMLVVVNVVYGLSLQFINAHSGPWVPERQRVFIIQKMFMQFEAGYAAEHSVLARAILFTVMTSVSIPLIIRFGSIWRINFGFVLLMLLWPKAVDPLLRFSLDASFFMGLSRWTVLAIVLMAFCLLISWRLSVWLYGRREL